MKTDFLLAFVPLFVAIDAIGMLPVFTTITGDLSKPDRSKVLNQAVLAAFVVSVAFLFTGHAVFRFLGISVSDFRVGGGLLLLLIAISDVTQSQKEQRRATAVEMGVVPIGIPLIIGPGSLTTLMILSDRVGYLLTLISLILNLALAWFCFSRAAWFQRIFGPSGLKAIGKVISIFLMAIAVMMIRVGLTEMFPKLIN